MSSIKLNPFRLDEHGMPIGCDYARVVPYEGKELVRAVNVPFAMVRYLCCDLPFIQFWSDTDGPFLNLYVPTDKESLEAAERFCEAISKTYGKG